MNLLFNLSIAAVYICILCNVSISATRNNEPVIHLRSGTHDVPVTWSRYLQGDSGNFSEVEEPKLVVPSFFLLTFTIDTVDFPTLYTRLQVYGPVSYIPTSSFIVYLHNISQYNDIQNEYPTLRTIHRLPSSSKSVLWSRNSTTNDRRTAQEISPYRRLFLEMKHETKESSASSLSSPRSYTLSVHRGFSSSSSFTLSSTNFMYTNSIQEWITDVQSRLVTYLRQRTIVTLNDTLSTQSSYLFPLDFGNLTGIRSNSTHIILSYRVETNPVQCFLYFRTSGTTYKHSTNHDQFFLHFSLSLHPTLSLSTTDSFVRNFVLDIHDWLIQQSEVLYIEYYTPPTMRNAFARPLVLSTTPGEYDRADIEYGTCEVQEEETNAPCYSDPLLETFTSSSRSIPPMVPSAKLKQPSLLNGKTLRSWLTKHQPETKDTIPFRKDKLSSYKSILTEWYLRDQLEGTSRLSTPSRTKRPVSLPYDYTDLEKYIHDTIGSSAVPSESFYSPLHSSSSSSSCSMECIQAKCDYGYDGCYRDQGWSIFYDKNITGKNQLIHMVDSGIDISHPFFYDPSFTTSIDTLYTKNWSVPLSNHRKIAMVYAMSDHYDSLNGHGTHVAGTITGTTYSNIPAVSPNDTDALDVYYSLLPFSGMAPDARLIFVDFYCDYGDDETNEQNGICTCPLQLDHSCYCDTNRDGKCLPNTISIPTYEPLVYESGYQNGARISSNSWGPADGIVTPFYSTVSRDHDSWIYHNHQDMLVIFAASNDGDGDELSFTTDTSPNFASISMQAAAKNVLTVGAMRNTIDNRMFYLLNYLSSTDQQSCTGLSLTAVDFINRSELPLQLPLCTANTCLQLAAASSIVDTAVSSASSSSALWDLALCCNCSVYIIMEEALTVGLDPYTVVTEGLTNYMARWRASYSSTGPTLDGRIKPDLMAVGSTIFSSRSTLRNQTLMDNPYEFRCPSASSVSTMDSPPFPTLVGQAGIRSISVVMGEDLTEPVFLSSVDVLVGPSTTATHIILCVKIYEMDLLVTQSVDLFGLVGTGSGTLTSPTYVNITTNIELPMGTQIRIDVTSYPDDRTLDLLVPDPVTNTPVPVCFGTTIPSIGLVYRIEHGNPLNSYLSVKSGTSMATPAVAGIAALVRQYFTDGYYNLLNPLDDNVNLPLPSYGFHPSAALLKAVLINSASPLLLANTLLMSTLSSMDRGGVNITRSQIVAEMGFGAVNLVRGISLPYLGKDARHRGDIVSLLLPGLALEPYPVGSPIPEPSAVTQQGTDPHINHHQLHVYCIDIQTVSDITELVSTLPLSVTLVWTDPPGSPLSIVSLVNNLDLEIITPLGTLVRGNEDTDYSTMDNPTGTDTLSSSVPIADDRNNVEKATFAVPTYTLDATHQRIAPMYTIIVRGTLIPQGPQPYSLVITGPNVYQTILPNNEGTCGTYPLPGYDALSPYDSSSNGNSNDAVNGLLQQLGSLSLAVSSAEGAAGGLGTVLALLAVGVGGSKLWKQRQEAKRKTLFTVTRTATASDGPGDANEGNKKPGQGIELPSILVSSSTEVGKPPPPLATNSAPSNSGNSNVNHRDSGHNSSRRSLVVQYVMNPTNTV